MLRRRNRKPAPGSTIRNEIKNDAAFGWRQGNCLHLVRRPGHSTQTTLAALTKAVFARMTRNKISIPPRFVRPIAAREKKLLPCSPVPPRPALRSLPRNKIRADVPAFLVQTEKPPRPAHAFPFRKAFRARRRFPSSIAPILRDLLPPREIHCRARPLPESRRVG